MPAGEFFMQMEWCAREKKDFTRIRWNNSSYEKNNTKTSHLWRTAAPTGIKMAAGSTTLRLDGGICLLCVCRESGWTADRVGCRVIHRISSGPSAVLPDVA